MSPCPRKLGMEARDFSRVRLHKDSVPARNIGLSCGGDALNEAVILSELGVKTELISLLGEDEAAGTILRCLKADMTTAKNGETVEDIEVLLKFVDYLIPNEKEAFILTGEKDPKKSASVLLEHGANTVIIKCGKDGCIYKSSSEEGEVHAYGDVTVVDTTGAGDSFVAGFVSGLNNGMSLRECCRYGCAVSSIVVEQVGTQGIVDIRNETDRRYELLLSQQETRL